MTDFTHDGYRSFLKLIRDLNRRAVSFRDIPSDGDYVILRHDVDFSLRRAVDMAHIDKEEGATATFFFLLTAPYYNPLTVDGIRALHTIVKLGHECGLHYDATGFERLTSNQRSNRIEALARALEDAAGTPVRAVAQHKPGRVPIRIDFPALVDAYAAPYFDDIGYVSDSRMVFRVPDLGAFLRENSRCQALIHPIWWRPKRMSRSAIFEALRNEIAIETQAMLEFEEESIERVLLKQSAPLQ